MGEDRIWRALDEPPGDAAAEFPELARAALIDRRAAMRLMAASAALAAVAACDRPPSRALRSAPRTSRDTGIAEYATTLDRNGHGFGVIVKTVGGWPTKIEGNPRHPLSRGASDVAAQAELLSLYDPDRSRTPVRRGRPLSWGEARHELRAWLADVRARRGAGLHVLLQPTASPTFERLVEAAKAALPEARFYGHRAIEEASDALPPVGEARAILSLGADFLGAGPFQVRLAQNWAEARRRGLADGDPPRLIVAESVPTLTGARADQRLPLAPAAIAALARAVRDALAGGPIEGDAVAIAAALRQAGPRALAIAGREQPGQIHALAREITALLGGPVVGSGRREGVGLLPIAALATRLGSREVEDLLILGGNPAFDAGPGFAALIRRARRSLHLGLTRDETGRACDWILPARHMLEGWGDFRAPDGGIGLAQPVAPTVPGISEIEFLALLAGERADGRALVRATWAGAAPDEEAWLRALENGVLPPQPLAPTPLIPLATAPPAPDGLVLLFRPAAHLWDGAAANNAWLQELPDPITKLVWGNAATLSPETARAHGLANGDVIAVTAGDRTLDAPVWIMPGQADGTVALTLGYGRTAAGRVGDGVGVDAFRLRPPGVWQLACAIRRTGATQRLVSTQQHQAVDDARAFRRVRPGGRAAPPPAPTPNLYAEGDPPGAKQWAMTIDLDACIGCAACTIACQAENNVPPVGADEVARGRAMHWIRVDRAFSGPAAEPAISFQPIPCMHCETAPCEPVCPVGATVHSSEGLNQMVYDRCIGTRSCSNNCPYKVRRFNWFDYQSAPLAAPETAQNPDVRIRESGVMEKCTYCVQRIEAERDGDTAPVTACQQACPTQAIRFGDLADPAGPIARDRADPRHYALLDGHNLAPRTTYLARIETRDG